MGDTYRNDSCSGAVHSVFSLEVKGALPLPVGL